MITASQYAQLCPVVHMPNDHARGPRTSQPPHHLHRGNPNFTHKSSGPKRHAQTACDRRTCAHTHHIHEHKRTHQTRSHAHCPQRCAPDPPIDTPCRPTEALRLLLLRRLTQRPALPELRLEDVAACSQACAT